MLEIIICEDEESQRKKMENFISNYISMEGMDMTIVLATENPFEVLGLVKADKKLRLYFLDVDLNAEINGFELGAEIRKHDAHGFIVYVTSHEEMALMNFIYKVGAIEYVVKSDFDKMQDKLKECLKLSQERTRIETKDKRLFKVPSDSKVVFVDHKDIVFFETDTFNRMVVLYTLDKRMKFYGTLKDIEKEDEKFVRCHKSFVINLDHIENLDHRNKQVVMSTGDKCEVSRKGMEVLSKKIK